ncbi:hypothetical protein CYY_002432 [Polysphondylium violaceum]|uniref:Transmembrane protein n=1 Tax=Polysphondylium violaceum TaxID=133409 RepID=A0A8J4Q1M2_9MYCE|nr:hypothetical protein CYY_002432 [Polysphondylium violaceum]
MKGYFLAFLFLVIIINITSVVSISTPIQHNVNTKISTSSIQNTINELYKEIQNYQNKKDKSYIPMVQWAEVKGLFQSDVRVNFVGNELKTEARRKFAIPDSNMFVTNFVVFTLLESHKLGTIDLDPLVLQDAITAILSFKDKNFINHDTAAVYTFWPQIFNSTLNVYSQYPMNLNHLILQYGSFQKFVDFFAEEFKLLNVLKDMQMIAEALDTVSMAFHIPSDADDSGCNLGLGQVLVNLPNSSQFASTIATWKQSNANITTLFDTYSKYAYRPFSPILDQNSIDPRSYYVLQDFLTSWKESNRDLQSLLLPTTWFESMSEQKNTFPDLQMPFNVNNVDFSVATNTLFGIASALYQLQLEAGNSDILDEIFTQDIQNLCLSTAYLIENVVTSQIVYNRSDLALLYYPSIYDFTWFVSRTVFFLQEFELAASNSNDIVFPNTLIQVLSILNPVVENLMTNQLVERLNVDAKSGGTYWDDFLGDGDTLFGKPEKYGEDRFFSTSLAINALIDTWTLPVANSVSARVWKSNTPDMIQTIIKSAVSYVNQFILDNPEQQYNAFFSGSVKGTDTLDFFYPANLCLFFNGTICNPHYDYENQFELANAVSGYIDSATYASMVQESWGNITTPTIFYGYNNASFPFWSSKPLTYSISILALSKYITL